MKRKLLIVVGVALAAATVSTIVFYQLISDSLAGNGSSARKTQQHPVVTATRDLPRGTRLGPADLQVTMLSGETPPGAYAQPAELTGRLVERDLRKDEPIAESGLAGPGPAVSIPPGMRAVSIHLSEYAGVAKMIENGDRVDVLAADNDRRPGSTETRVHTVLQGVEVLDAGKDEEMVARRGAAPVVTLLIETKDVETLTLADQAGAIRLVLRNPLDNTTEETAGADWRDVAGKRTGNTPRSRTARPAPNVTAAQPPAKSSRAPEPSARSQAPQPAGDDPVSRDLAAVMPDLHSRRPGSKTPPPAAESSSVLLAVTFAGLGDEALAELTSGLAKRYTNVPMILSAFEPGWDLQSRLRKLRQSERLEVFSDPNLLALEQSEASFERHSNARLAAGNEPETQTPCADRVGMRISFTPTVGAADKLRIRVTSEVAVPDPHRKTKIGDCEAPLVATREWSGEIELADGQSFWVRGLIDRPGAWDFLRRLFPQRPLEFDRNDELAILVTPKLVADKDGKPLSAVLPR